MVEITIDGIDLSVPKGENIIEAARKAGIDIPYFCYHPRLSKGDAANCRMCLVDTASKMPDGTVRKMPKPQTACTLPAAPGLIVYTNTEQVFKDRRGVLEFLLINHPLDCPVCDRGGECPLQNNTVFYGASASRYTEEKRHYPKAYPLSQHVVFDSERCIQCARCTRFSEDISGDAQLALLKRGGDAHIGTFAHTEYNSKFSGNVIELCPVGALTSRSYRFKARPWDLQTQNSICSRCSNGCNIKLDYRMDSVVRVNARLNEDVNEEWTCDKGKFGHDYVSSPERLTRPMLRNGSSFEPISWGQAYQLLITQLKKAGGHTGVIGGGRCTNEDNYMLQKLVRGQLKSSHLDSRALPVPASGDPLAARMGFRSMGSTIADIEDKKSIFVFGCDLEDEQPIIFLRVRKAWRFKGAKVVFANSHVATDSVSTADFADPVLKYTAGAELAVLQGLLVAILAHKPDVATSLPASITPDVASWTLESSSSASGIDAALFADAAAALCAGASTIIAGKSVQLSPNYAQLVDAMGAILALLGSPHDLNIPVTECNSLGAMDMGVLPDFGPGTIRAAQPGFDTAGMLQGALHGDIAALWLVATDIAVHWPDRDLIARALEACPFVVVSELTMTETARMAHLVLPAASMAEKDGCFTNCEGRVQRLHRAFAPVGECKPDWLIFSEVAALLGAEGGPVSARDITCMIASEVPTYAGMLPAALGQAGLVRPENGVANA
jgi:NADH-quinone oxidoreductase subunit G